MAAEEVIVDVRWQHAGETKRYALAVAMVDREAPIEEQRHCAYEAMDEALGRAHFQWVDPSTTTVHSIPFEECLRAVHEAVCSAYGFAKPNGDAMLVSWFRYFGPGRIARWCGAPKAVSDTLDLIHMANYQQRLAWGLKEWRKEMQRTLALVDAHKEAKIADAE